MMTKEQQIARIFKAFCDENRVMILQKLQGGEVCACKLLEELNISQSTLSHHMRVLADADVINCRREGKWIHYSISEEGGQTALAILKELLTLKEGSVCTAENETAEKKCCCGK